MKPLTLADRAIIDAFPVFVHTPTVLTVGAGKCRLETHLANFGYTVFATDYKQTWEDATTDVQFSIADILDIDSFSLDSAPIVVCSQVLEHLVDYEGAFANLMALTENRLIVTVPQGTSFNDTSPAPKGHCNYWLEKKKEPEFKSINEFKTLASPYSVAISQILTKEIDRGRQWGYLIVVDKNQKIH